MTDRWAWGAIAAIGSTALVVLGSCDNGTISDPGATTGGAGGAAGGSTAPSGGGGSEPACIQPIDAYCDEAADCECAMCEPAARCQPDGNGCITNNGCDVHEDACTCSDCDWAGRCFESHGADCNGDGSCDFATEGCGCPDCHDVSTCLDNHAMCAGGAPDGSCEPLVEDCACTDCLGSLECLCPDPLECPAQACVCEGCWDTWYCEDDEACVDDGLCAWGQHEGCHCADCELLAPCVGYPG